MRHKNAAIRWSSIAAGFIIPALAAKLARSSAGRFYKLTSKGEPPKNPAARNVAWSEAIVWTLICGIVGGMARLLARRSLPHFGLPAAGYDLEDETGNAMD